MDANDKNGRFDGILKLVHVDAVFTVEVVEQKIQCLVVLIAFV